MASKASVASTISLPVRPVVRAMLWPTGLLTGESMQECYQMGLSEACIIFPWLWGGGKLSFKLSSLFLRASQGYAGVPLYPIPFLDLWGFHALILSSLLRLSQAGLLPFMVPILAPTMHALAEEFPPHCLPLPHHLGEQASCSLARLESWSFRSTWMSEMTMKLPFLVQA